VLTQAHLTHLVCYLRFNPQRHGLIGDFRDRAFSSYRAHLSSQATRLKRETVLAWFDGPASFAATHEMAIDQQALAPLVPEDFD
jgi:hypothetical protein